AAARGTETAKDRVCEPQERPVLVDPAEVVHGVAGDVIAEGPRTRCAVPARGAEERVEVRGHAVIGERRLDAASAGAAVAAVDRADVRGLDARQIGFECNA